MKQQIKCYCGHTITCDCEPLEETIEEVAIKNKDFIAGAKWQNEQNQKEIKGLKNRINQLIKLILK